MIHLRLLSTPPHGDAVTFGYRPESACLEGTSTLLTEYTFRRTRTGFPAGQGCSHARKDRLESRSHKRLEDFALYC